MTRDLKFLRNCNIRWLRFNNPNDGWWFPWTNPQYKNHVKTLIQRWVTDFGGAVAITACGWTPGILEAVRQKLGKTTIYDVSIDDVELTRFKNLLSNMDLWDIMLDDAKEAIHLVNHPGVFIDIWNGAESWMDACHVWTVTDTPTRIQLRKFEQIVHMIADSKNVSLLPVHGRHRAHKYIGADGNPMCVPLHDYGTGIPMQRSIPKLPFPNRTVFTEVGVSRVTDAFYGGSWEVVYQTPNTTGWVNTLDQFKKITRIVYIHSFLDGRFKPQTWDIGDCESLYTREGYENLLTSTGKPWPHYDGVFHSLYIDATVRNKFRELGLNTSQFEGGGDG